MTWSTIPPHDNSPIKNIAIFGADIIGWCAAVGLARGLQGQNVNITIVDCSLNKQPLTQNDAVIHCSSHLFDFHRLLGIQDKQLLANGSAKLCSGTQFTNFSGQQADYFIGSETTQASFCTVELHHVLDWLGIDDATPYSLSALAAQKSLLALPTNNKDEITAGFAPSVNLDGESYQRFMQGAAKQLGISLIKANIKQINYHNDSGFVSQVELDNGVSLQPDLVIDNSGQQGVFTRSDSPRKYHDCAALIPFDRKMYVRLGITQQAKPYQQFIATDEGIIEVNFMPHLHEISLLYSSKTTTDEQAKEQLRKLVADCEPSYIKQIQFGYTDQVMQKNCFAIGQTAGYLGSSPFSSLILCQRSISKLLELFPGKACLTANTTELNRRIAKDYQQALEYSLLMLMYSAGKPQYLWQSGLNQLPETLQHKIKLFSSSGRVGSELNPLVSRIRWLTLLKHKIVNRQGYDPVLDALNKDKATQFLHQLSQKIQQCMSQYRPYS